MSLRNGASPSFLINRVYQYYVYIVCMPVGAAAQFGVLGPTRA